jgi:hypothetical protein
MFVVTSYTYNKERENERRDWGREKKRKENND